MKGHRCDCGNAYAGTDHEDRWCSAEATHVGNGTLYACREHVEEYAPMLVHVKFVPIDDVSTPEVAS